MQITAAATAFLFTLLPALTAAHGYLSSPPPRGIEKEAYGVDALKSPNVGGKVCRGEPEGQITQVKLGSTVTLDFTITAPHTGPCEVYLLDLDLDVSKQVKIASKYDCAATGKVAPWDVKLPINQFGRKVLRWTWLGLHQGPPGEPYEQCVDLMIGSIDLNKNGRGATLYKSDSAPPAPRRRPVLPPQPTPPPRALPSPPAPQAAAQPHYAPVPEPSYDAPSYGGEPEPVMAYEAPDAGYGAAEEDDAYADDASEEAAYGDAAPSAGAGGACTQGKFVCNQDGTFSICNNNAWVKQACGTGQVCVPSNGSITCQLAN